MLLCTQTWGGQTQPKKGGQAFRNLQLVAINKCWYIYKKPNNVKCNTLKIRFSNWIPQEGIVDEVNCN